MPNVDAKTVNRNYPLALPSNQIDYDAPRVNDAFEAIDLDVATLLVSVALKANISALAAYQLLTGKNAANGYAGLDGASKLAGSQLPFFTGSVLDNAALPARLRETAVVVTDWDSAVTAGFYQAGITAANSPAADQFLGIVNVYSVNYIRQDLVARDGSTAYRRFKTAGAWGGWERVRAGEAEQDARYALASEAGWKRIAQTNITTPVGNYSFAISGMRFIRILISRLQPVTDGVHLVMKSSTDGGTIYSNVTSACQWVKDIAAGAGAETNLSSAANLLTGGSATPVSNSGTEGGWSGEIRLNGASQARPMSGELFGAWKNGAAHMAIRGSFLDTGLTIRTHIRIDASSGSIDNANIIVLGMA